MKIGIIGAGAVALAFSRAALAAGHEVVLSNSGDAGRLAAAVAQLGSGASGAPVGVAAQCELVLLAVPWPAVPGVLAAVPSWHGRILVDATNPFLSITPHWVLDDLGDDTASEFVARLAPDARVVKAFNSLQMASFAQGPQAGGARRVLLVSGDDPAARRVVSELIGQFGFHACDLGKLREGGRLQQAGGALARGDDLLVAPAATAS